MRSEPRVLIDATAVPADRGGVGRYVDSLVAALDTDGARLAIACQQRDGVRYGELAPHATIVPAGQSVVTRTARLGWEQTSLPVLARKLGTEVVHSPHYTMPLAHRGASVVTLHDATFFTDPALHSSVKARFFRGWTRTALRRAEHCVVPSEATARALDGLHGTAVRGTAGRENAAGRGNAAGRRAAKVEVIAHGVDPERFHPPSDADIAAAREAIGLGETSYVAFLGALEPRKNVPALIRGFAEAVAERTDPPALVLAGQAGWDSQVERALDDVPHRLRVIRTGYLPYDTLSGFLGGAELVAYPSLGEGFGFPVLEAMACGGCVLTTRRLALPEVGGDAVAYCDAGEHDVAVTLAELLDDPARRSRLAEAAERRAKEFAWSASAARHRETYERSWLRACS